MGMNAILQIPHQHSPEEIKLPPVWLGFSAICIVFQSESQTLSYFTGVSKEALQSVSETQPFQLVSITKESLWRSRNCTTDKEPLCSPHRAGKQEPHGLSNQYGGKPRVAPTQRGLRQWILRVVIVKRYTMSALGLAPFQGLWVHEFIQAPQ